MVLAALGIADAVAAGLLLLFVVWGMRRGPLRQVGSLILLAAAFPLAARFGPPLEERVVRAVSEEGSSLTLVSWSVVFLGVLVLGGLGLALAQPLLKRQGDAPRRRGGGVLGLFHGVLVLTVLGYGLLLAFPGRNAPDGWVRRLETSVAARAMRVVGRGVREVAPLPPGVREHLEAVDARIGP